jgi:hypothetical protein
MHGLKAKCDAMFMVRWKSAEKKFAISGGVECVQSMKRSHRLVVSRHGALRGEGEYVMAKER